MVLLNTHTSLLQVGQRVLASVESCLCTFTGYSWSHSAVLLGDAVKESWPGFSPNGGVATREACVEDGIAAISLG